MSGISQEFTTFGLKNSNIILKVFKVKVLSVFGFDIFFDHAQRPLVDFKKSSPRNF